MGSDRSMVCLVVGSWRGRLLWGWIGGNSPLTHEEYKHFCINYLGMDRYASSLYQHSIWFNFTSLKSLAYSDVCYN